ncbi:response regulator transcription factor [Kibdelosporangium persicum]|uniref:Response regulator transcription factor n=1 Tax=Kibdelosporangium persicum TaxID=2698649 RepID=A0ABX2F3U2_9PSEU|nr:response regulator transcription factor [Kibdelosporangium persicum]NRN65819.1 Response regulator transcription factor [Kibdelosporangium persicum]
MTTEGNRRPEEDDVIRVAIVDDHPIARYGIEHVLTGTRHIDVVLTAGSVRELAEALPEHTALDVLIVDLYLGTDEPALAAVTELAASTRVLVMSASGRPADVLGAIRAGASGYITKHSGAELIISTVETVAAGGFLLSAELADVIQAELIKHLPAATTPAADSGPRLSPREEETLRWVAKGFTHAQIGTRMGVSKATVDTYVERIRAKLQVGNKAELTRAALNRLNNPGTNPGRWV